MQNSEIVQAQASQDNAQDAIKEPQKENQLKQCSLFNATRHSKDQGKHLAPALHVSPKEFAQNAIYNHKKELETCQLLLKAAQERRNAVLTLFKNNKSGSKNNSISTIEDMLFEVGEQDKIIFMFQKRIKEINTDLADVQAVQGKTPSEILFFLKKEVKKLEDLGNEKELTQREFRINIEILNKKEKWQRTRHDFLLYIVDSEKNLKSPIINRDQQEDKLSADIKVFNENKGALISDLETMISSLEATIKKCQNKEEAIKLEIESIDRKERSTSEKERQERITRFYLNRHQDALSDMQDNMKAQINCIQCNIGMIEVWDEDSQLNQLDHKIKNEQDNLIQALQLPRGVNLDLVQNEDYLDLVKKQIKLYGKKLDLFDQVANLQAMKRNVKKMTNMKE